MARLRESDETRAATPFSRPSLWPQLWSKTVVWPQRVHLPTPFSSTSSPAQRRSTLLALSGRRETPDCVTCRGELQAAGLPTHRSSGRGRPLFEHRNSRALRVCSFTPRRGLRGRRLCGPSQLGYPPPPGGKVFLFFQVCTATAPWLRGRGPREHPPAAALRGRCWTRAPRSLCTPVRSREEGCGLRRG